MTVINTNVKSLVAQDALSMNNRKLQTAMERLSTGSRINSAKDDAAGLAISSRMEAQVRGLNAAIRNANDGISLAQTAEGAMDEISNMLQRMRELAVQAASATNNSADRANLDAEVQQLKTEIDRVVSTTRFNDKKLLDGSFSGELQIGAKSSETMGISVANVSTAALGTVSGTSSVAGVTEGSFQGTQASPTVSQITFGTDGTYSFVLRVQADASTTKDYQISGVVANGSAEDVVDKINAAIRDDALGDSTVTSVMADTLTATYNGRVVTLQNNAGGLISVASGTSTTSIGAATGSFSTSGATATYTTIAGGTNSSNVTLGSNSPAVTKFNATNKLVQDRQPSEVRLTMSGTAQANEKLSLTLVSGGVTTVLETTGSAAVGSIGALVTALRADSDYDTAGYYISKTTTGGTHLVIERYDGASFTIDATHKDTAGGAHATASAVDLTLYSINSSTSASVLGSSTFREVVQYGAKTVGQAAASTTEPNEVALTFEKTATLVASDQFNITLVSGGVTTVLSTGAMTTPPAVGDEVDGIIAAIRAESAYANSGYTVGKNGNNQIVISKTDGASFALDATFVNGTTAKTTSKLLAPAGTDLVASTSLYNVTSTSSPMTMYLDFLGQDDYTFQFNSSATTASATAALQVAYTGTAANLLSIAADLEANLSTLATPSGQANPYDFNVTVENGRIRVDENNGYAFHLVGFKSDSGGRVSASLGTGQTSAASTTSALLDDSVAALSATSVAKGLATATAVNLEFNEGGTTTTADTYSFKISDGNATAVISNVLFKGQASSSDTSMKAAIEAALTASGLDSVITLSGPTSDVFTLTHKLGYEITISDFQSTSSTALKVSAGTSTTGVTRYLDDNFVATAGAVVSSVDVLSASKAQDAIGIIDAAIEDISSERASLGAMQSRLTHTINNLTNISTNTSESRSRIQDTDYAKETAELARTQIIQQAATAMLAQANQSNMSVLSLLQ